MGQSWQTRDAVAVAVKTDTSRRTVTLSKMEALALLARLSDPYDVALTFHPRNDPRFPIIMNRVEKIAFEVEELHRVTIETPDDAAILADCINSSPLYTHLVELLHDEDINDVQFKEWQSAMSSVTLLLKSNGVAAERFPT